MDHPAEVEYLLDGRVIDITTKKVLPKLTSCVYEITEGKEKFLAKNLTEAGSIVGLYPDTLSKHLDIKILGSKDAYIKIKNHTIRRVRIFAGPLS